MEINEGTFSPIASLSGQTDPVTVALSGRADAVLVTVSVSPDRPTWFRAGTLKQYALVGDSRAVILSRRVDLRGHLIEIFPVNTCELVFYPVNWLEIYSISLKARSIL